MSIFHGAPVFPTLTQGLKLNDEQSSQKERQRQKSCVSFGKECKLSCSYQHVRVVSGLVPSSTISRKSGVERERVLLFVAVHRG